MMDGDKLIIASLSNVVQIQIENAAVGDFAIQPDADGDAGDVLIAFQPQDGSTSLRLPARSPSTP